MGVDVNRLAPWAQKQILAKYRAELEKKGVPAQEKSRKKYNNAPDSRAGAEGAQIRFASKAEARRYDELMLLLKTGKIHDLKLQPEYTLQEAYTTPEGKRVRAIKYVADFSYVSESGFVVEDVKGGRATQTRVYSIKKKLMREKFGITITEVEA